MVFFNEAKTQSKVVSRQTRMSREIQVRVRGTGEGRFRESRDWSRSLRQAWVGAKRVNTNIKGKGTGRRETNKQINK